MQICNCSVAIGGEVGMTVRKERVSVPELLVLREIHGADAVRNVEVIGEVARDSNEERARLRSMYPKAGEDGKTSIVEGVLGKHGPLPKVLGDTDFPEDFILNGGKKAKPAKASAVQELQVEVPPPAPAPAPTPAKK